MDKDTKVLSQLYATLSELGIDSEFSEKEFKEDDKVLINTDQILNRSTMGKLSKPYLRFIRENNGKVFTVHLEKNGLISLKEHPEWLFWSGDLYLAEDDSE